MTFSSKLKKELCKINNDNNFNLAKIYGLILFSKSFDLDNSLILKTENKTICLNFSKMLSEIFNIISDTITQKSLKKNIYILKISNKEDRLVLLAYFYLRANSCKNLTFLENKILKNKDLIPHFLSGVFLSCGVITNPSLDYRIEWNVYSEELAVMLKNLLSSLNLKLHVHMITRKSSFIVYIKSYDNITDLLTFMGAPNSSMELIQVKMLKEVRNQINRTTNFETANFNKTVVASTEQIMAIEKIKREIGFENLPDELRELAKLRLENREMSFKDLGERLSKPLSKSGVNYRMKKLLNFLK